MKDIYSPTAVRQSIVAVYMSEIQCSVILSMQHSGTHGMSPPFCDTSRLYDLNRTDEQCEACDVTPQPTWQSASKPLTATGAYSLLIQPRLWVTTCGAKPWAASYLCQCRGEERNIMVTLHKANYRCGCLLALLSRQCDAWALWCQRGTSLIGGDIWPLRFGERMTKHFL